MKKMFVMAIMMTTAIFASAENENAVKNNAAAEPEITEIAAEAPETENVAEIILNDIDPVVSTAFHVDENRQVYVIEIGERFIRVKDFQTMALIQTLSIYLNKENGTWVEGANNVMCYEGRFYPAKKILNGKGITYKGAKHAQYVPMKRVRSVEKEYQIWL